MDTIIAAIIGLLGVVLGAVIKTFADEIKDWLRRRRQGVTNTSAVVCPIEIYDTRNASDEVMIRDIARLKCAAFYGISHQSLTIYLESALSRLLRDETLELIEVCYASDVDGRLWEHEAYPDNIIRSRQEIAHLLTSPQWLLPRVNSARFIQSQHHATYGGCLVGRPDQDQVVYIANYLPTPKPDAKDSLTFRLTLKKELKDCASQMAALYASGYQHIRNKAVSLGDFSPSLWDLSADEWARFASTCNAHLESMRHICAFGDLSGNENVIDVACGDGSTSAILYNSIPNGQLTVLDASPQMVARAKVTLPNHVRPSLQVVPPKGDAKLIDLIPPYDIIILHLALPNIANDLASLTEFAQWTRTILTNNGHLLIAAHNTAVQLEQSDFDIKADPLRRAIRDLTDERIRRPLKSGAVFTEDEIENAFRQARYSLRDSNVRSFPMSMRDRILMWSTPAVLDDLIDVRKTSTEDRRDLMNKVRIRVSGQSIPNMTVKYWKWTPE